MTTNKDRADRAHRYAHLYDSEINNDDDIESAITDLMADLAHLAEEYYGGGEEALRIAAMHYHEEKEEEREGIEV